MDLYRPKDASGPLPVIVSVHGGGWAYGDKERYQWYCMDLAARGFAVVNFTYRLAPEYKFPAGIEDTCLVFGQLSRYDDWLDLNRLYAVGDSAGAHMLTIYCAMAGNHEYERLMGLSVPRKADGTPVMPRAVGLNCGVYEIDLSNANGMTKGLMEALLPQRGRPEEIRLINPLPFITERFPRAFVLTANADPLAGPPAREGLIRRLTEAGVPFRDEIRGTKEHPLQHVFHLAIRTADAIQINHAECEWFLKGENEPC